VKNDNQTVKVGDEVVVFTNYGRASTHEKVKSLDKWALVMESGEKYSIWDFPRKFTIAVKGSDRYRDAISDHRCKVIIDILGSSDATENPIILKALEVCAAQLGEEELRLRHSRLISMGASHTEDEHVYRKGTIDNINGEGK